MKIGVKYVFAPFSNDGGADVEGQLTPEPGTLLLVGLGLAGIGIASRRKAAGKAR